MSGFIYKNKSTETILSSSRLIIATFDEVNEVVGHERENVLGNNTLSRPIANEYGTLYNRVSFEYALIKENLEPFTDEEQKTVETWLSSPKYDSDIQLIDCYGYTNNIYTGKFINTRWLTSAGGWVGVAFIFECNSPYPHVHYEHNYTITDTRVITLNCKSDELEEYTYPTLTLFASNGANTVLITNITDDDHSMSIDLPNRLNVVIDCHHCILSDGTTEGIVDFEDVGWADVGNIYWMRLLAGDNTITVNGNCQLKIEYDAVSKKVGGWL